MASVDKLEPDMVCQMEKYTKSFSLKIVGYSLTKLGRSENSYVVGTFELADHIWAVHFSPFCTTNDTRSFKICQCSDYNVNMTLYISLLTETKSSMYIEFEFSVLDYEKGRYSVDFHESVKLTGYVSKQGGDIGTHFIHRSVFESSGYLKDDSFVLKCSARLVKPSLVDARKKRILVPPSDFHGSKLHQNFCELWSTLEGADVAFKVSKETFVAHRKVLVARSPVFRAQLLGPMIESKSDCIKIEDMNPGVFELMLYFMYNDTVPLEEMSFKLFQHLLVAADRYGVERLKLMCEEKLSASLDVETAATTLVLAEQHSCEQLKEMCIDFVASREKLQAVMATDGFSYLMESCPFILKDLLLKLDCERRINRS